MPVAPIPIRLGENLIYGLHLADGGMLLVDAGPDAMGTWAEVQGRTSSRGFAVSDVRAVLVTHAHIDHAGLASRWALAGATIYAGAPDVPALLAGREWNDVRLPLRLAALKRHGAPEELLLVYEADQRRRGLAWEPCERQRVQSIEDGTRIELADGARMHVIAAPGHTPGNLVAIIEEESGDLYAGDTLLPDQVPTPGLHFPLLADGSIAPRWPSLPSFLRSIASLHDLGPHRTLSAHGQPGANSHRLIARFQAHHARRAALYRRLLMERSESAFDLAERAFPHLNLLQLAAAMIEVIGHLDLLMESAAAEREPFDAVWRYRLTRPS